MCAGIAGDGVGVRRLHVLQRYLHVIQPGCLQPCQPRAVEPDGRVIRFVYRPGLVRRRDDLCQIAARRRFAAGQMHLQHAHRRRLAEHTRPGRRVQLVRAIVQRQRVRAIRAGEGAAMRQFGQQAEWRRNGPAGVRRGQAASIRFAANSASIGHVAGNLGAVGGV